MRLKQTLPTHLLVLILSLSFSLCAFGQASEDDAEDSQAPDVLAAQKGEQSEAEEPEPVKRGFLRRKAKTEKDYFSVKVRPSDKEDDVLLVQVTLARRPKDERWIGETIVYWVGPDGGGFSIPIRPVTESALAAQVYGPFEPGQHKLLVSLAVRGSDSFIETFYEQEFTLQVPSLELSSTPMRRLPSLSGSGGAGDPNVRSGTSGWITVLKWLGFITAGVLALALLGIGGLILRRRGILNLPSGLLSAKFAAPFLAKFAAIKASRKNKNAPDQKKPDESTSDENPPDEKAKDEEAKDEKAEGEEAPDEKAEDEKAEDGKAEDRTIVAEKPDEHPEGATVVEAIEPTENPAADPPSEPESEPKSDEDSVPSDTADGAESADPDDLQEQAF